MSVSIAGQYGSRVPGLSIKHPKKTMSTLMAHLVLKVSSEVLLKHVLFVVDVDGKRKFQSRLEFDGQA